MVYKFHMIMFIHETLSELRGALETRIPNDNLLKRMEQATMTAFEDPRRSLSVMKEGIAFLEDHIDSLIEEDLIDEVLKD